MRLWGHLYKAFTVVILIVVVLDDCGADKKLQLNFSWIGLYYSISEVVTTAVLIHNGVNALQSVISVHETMYCRILAVVALQHPYPNGQPKGPPWLLDLFKMDQLKFLLLRSSIQGDGQDNPWVIDTSEKFLRLHVHAIRTLRYASSQFTFLIICYFGGCLSAIVIGVFECWHLVYDPNSPKGTIAWARFICFYLLNCSSFLLILDALLRMNWVNDRLPSLLYEYGYFEENDDDRLILVKQLKSLPICVQIGGFQISTDMISSTIQVFMLGVLTHIQKRASAVFLDIIPKLKLKLENVLLRIVKKNKLAKLWLC
ncbi:hypothetical protein RFI_02672 [Reticulomyxa filosa]|uniref:Gustatory receptor n=1 Tax=Reticulomyxa filosa TaxID=46433 RepID=X6P7D6_RETFI|nr:hypothetical protein RFI_02672 [Reticulomyxa filosa]|eukprot:ETO34420.1 hypothetical protein RFI_02672 [Reticulomyxa filosa]